MIRKNNNKTPKNDGAVSNEVIKKVHFALANLTSGEEIINFLRSTEPIFMSEVSRFTQTEMYRFRFNLTEQQVFYIGSVISAAYIAGFLIAREAFHKLYNGIVEPLKSIDQVINQEDIDNAIDKMRDDGKSFAEIGKTIRKMMKPSSKKQPKKKRDSPKQKRLDLESLEE